MSKYLFKLSICFSLIFTLLACDEGGSGRARKGKKKGGKESAASLPTPGTKVAFIFPAGAGAMRVILGITEKFESDLGINGLGSVVDAAGGVSSGSLVASALTYDNPPKITSKDLKAKVGTLVRDVFVEANNLVDFLVGNYNFTLRELEAVFIEINNGPPDLTSQASAEAGLEQIIKKASSTEFSIMSKIKAKGDLTAFVTALGPQLTPLINNDVATAARLTTNVINILGDIPLSDPKISRFLAFATGDKKPVFFGPAAFSKFVSGPFAVGATKLHEALVASSAIPNFVKASNTISFTMPEGGTKNIPDLSDGFFATEGRFDPSAVFFEAFTKMFAGEDLLIVYVGNGAKVDAKFRKMLRDKYGFSSKISQHTTDQGKMTTFVAIEADIKDDNGKTLFNLSGFYDSKDLARFMDNASQEAVKSKAYDWALQAIKASKQ